MKGSLCVAMVLMLFTGLTFEAGQREREVANNVPLSSLALPVLPACGDDRDKIIKEYKDHGVTLTPACADFTQTAHSQHFSFSEINKGDFAWALIRKPLTVAASDGYGLDKWREEYGSARIVNSGYRNPARNAAVGGAPQSRHMYGDAVDFRNVAVTEDEWNKMNAAAVRAKADFIEPRNGPCALNCVHADWRAHAGGYSQ